MASSKSRRRSHKRNELATRDLFDSAEILNAGKRTRADAIKLSVKQLDDVELDTAWQAALRGDYQTASARIARTLQPPVKRKRKAKGYTPWREPIVRKR